MLRSVHIENFRALREFRMSGLGRVNLLVGTNNCGKTSVLEAIHILALAGTSRPLVDALYRRGEITDERHGGQAAVGHLAHGHMFGEGRLFAIQGTTDGLFPRRVSATVLTREAARVVPSTANSFDRSAALQRWELPFVVRMEWSREGQEHGLDIAADAVGGVRSPPPGIEKAERDHARFVTTKGVSDDDLVTMLDAALLTPTEGIVLDALHAIEPEIERLATIGPRDPQHDDFGSIVTMVAGRRLPLGSLGDGIKRLLGLSLALAHARGGILLVDEIDTGLHFKVLTKMWRLVFETAARLDVQVFATTHSRDCFEALAEITVPDRQEISLQRIERDRSEAVAYREGVLRRAAEHGIEVR